MFPEDVPANKCDRIYAYLLWRCERKYGRNFWSDFFKEIGKEYTHLRDAVKLKDSDKIRNKRHQIVINCFDRLEGLDFKAMLKKANISLTTDVKALHPEEPGWDRRFISSDPVNNIIYESIDKESSIIETAEIIRILEKEQVKAIKTTHAQTIYIQLTDGREYKGTYVYEESGKYANDPHLYDILNLVLHIQKKRPQQEVKDWSIACE